MPAIKRNHVEDARGLGRLAFDAAAGIVDVVERMHRTVQRVPGPLGAAVEERTRGITGLVYRSVRGGLQMVGEGSMPPSPRWQPCCPKANTRHSAKAWCARSTGSTATTWRSRAIRWRSV